MEKRKNIIISVLSILLIISIGLLVYLLFFYKKIEEPHVDDNQLMNQDNNLTVEQNNNSESQDSTLWHGPKVEYELGTSYDYSKNTGVTYIKGYATTEKVCPFCAYGHTEYDDVVYFNVVESDDEFSKFLADTSLYKSEGKKAIQMGCLKDSIISYTNIADLYAYENDKYVGNYIKHFKLNSSISQKIMASSIDNPIKLKIEIYPWPVDFATDGITCYSDASTIEIVE